MIIVSCSIGGPTHVPVYIGGNKKEYLGQRCRTTYGNIRCPCNGIYIEEEICDSYYIPMDHFPQRIIGETDKQYKKRIKNLTKKV